MIPEDDIELQSIWPQLSKVLKWLVEHNDEEAVDALDLTIQKRRREIQRESPEVDVTDALKSTIMSLIREGIEVDRLKEPGKRAQLTPQSQEKEDSKYREPEDIIEDIIRRHLKEKNFKGRKHLEDRDRRQSSTNSK